MPANAHSGLVKGLGIHKVPPPHITLLLPLTPSCCTGRHLEWGAGVSDVGEEAAGGAEPDTEGPRSHVTVGGGAPAD